MWNGDSGYSGCGTGTGTGTSVTGADKPPVPGLVRWAFPVVVWRP
jgi:hypothetical protein